MCHKARARIRGGQTERSQCKKRENKENLHLEENNAIQI